MAKPPLPAAVVLALLAGPALAQQADSPEALYQQGIRARDAGRPEEAVERFRQVLAAQPENVDARVQLGFALTARRRFAEAEREFERVLQQTPNYDDARLGLARISFFSGDLAAAERRLAELRRRAPDNPEVKALAEQVGRAREEARKAAAAAAERRWIEAARAERRRGRFAEAERLYREVLQGRPRDGELWVELGLVQAFQGRFDDARRAFERALAIAPRNLDAVLGLARIDLYTNALDAADRRLDQVLAARPSDRDAHALRARVRLARGDAEGAERDFRALAAAAPRELDYQLGLGDALRAQGRDEEARAAFEAARAIDPASTDVRSRLALKIRPRWRLDVSGGYSNLTEGLESWREGRVSLGYALNQRTTITGAAEINRRFGLTDVTLDGRVDHRWSAIAAGYLRVGGTPEADFRPEVFAEGGGTLRLLPGGAVIGATFGLLDLAYARYPTGDTRSASVGLQQYLFAGRFWLTGRLIGTLSETDDRLGGYSVRADWLVTERFGVFLGYADAPDSSDGRTIETRALFGGLTFALTDEVSLSLSGASEDRKNSYDRTTVAVGVTTRF